MWIKESITLRKKEIVEEIKALRENQRFKNNGSLILGPGLSSVNNTTLSLNNSNNNLDIQSTNSKLSLSNHLSKSVVLKKKVTE